MITAIYYGLTYDELIHGHRYPYLYYPINDEWFYKNPNDSGVR